MSLQRPPHGLTTTTTGPRDGEDRGDTARNITADEAHRMDGDRRSQANAESRKRDVESRGRRERSRDVDVQGREAAGDDADHDAPGRCQQPERLPQWRIEH